MDDSSLVRLYCREVLERAGYEVEQAINGIEAMEKVLGARIQSAHRRRQYAKNGRIFFSSCASRDSGTKRRPFRPSS